MKYWRLALIAIVAILVVSIFMFTQNQRNMATRDSVNEILTYCKVAQDEAASLYSEFSMSDDAATLYRETQKSSQVLDAQAFLIENESKNLKRDDAALATEIADFIWTLEGWLNEIYISKVLPDVKTEVTGMATVVSLKAFAEETLPYKCDFLKIYSER
jgi:hypothetical protein